LLLFVVTLAIYAAFTKMLVSAFHFIGFIDLTRIFNYPEASGNISK